MRLANRYRALPSVRETMPQNEAADAKQEISEAIRKHGPKPGLMQAMSLLNEFLGRYNEAYDFAKQGLMHESVLEKLQNRYQVASLLRDKLYPDEALLVEPLRLHRDGSVWAVVIGQAFLKSDRLYTADYRVNRQSKEFYDDYAHDSEVRSGYKLAIYQTQNGSLKMLTQSFIADVPDRLSETPIYVTDLDGDGSEEAIVSCIYLGASWMPTTYAVAGRYKGKWEIHQSDTFELSGYMADVDKDGSIEIIGQQNIGDLGHSSQPRYPVAYRWERGKLVNADAHIRPRLRRFLVECVEAERKSNDDVELLGCQARALRVLGRNKEAIAYYRRAAKLDKAWANRLWDGMTPFRARE